jgi:sec-independent protein translocase protein TatA
MEVFVIMVLALLLFGPKKLPEIGRSLGKGLREFRKSTSGLMDSINMDEPARTTASPAPPQTQASAPAKPQATSQKQAAPEPQDAPEEAVPVAAKKPAPKTDDDVDELVIDLETKDTPSK